MWKVLSGVIVGVFVGAAIFEIINRRNPAMLRKVEDRARRTVRAAADAFDEGYHRRDEVEVVSAG